MPLQGIDSDLSPLTQGGEALTDNSSMQPISTPSSSFPQTMPSYLQPTSRDLTSQETTPGQDIQQQTGNIQKPNLGMMLLLGALGGPGVVNDFYARSMQKQIEPIVGQINLQYRQALNAGDFSGAQKLVNQLAPLTQYSPTAGKLYESFTNEIAKRQDNVQQNKIFISNMLTTGLVKEGTPYYRYLSDPNTLLQDKEVVQKSPEVFKRDIQVIGGVPTTIEALTREPLKQYPLPEATKAETLPKPLQNALLAIGPGAPTRFAYLQTKVSTGQATPDEMTEYKLFGNAVTAQTQQNIRTEQFPISEQIKTGATPEQVQGITSGSQSVRPSLQSRPQGNIKGKGPIPSTGRNDLENQGIAFRLGDAVANGKMSEPEAQDIASRLGITLHVSGPQGSVAGQLRSQQAGAEIGETYGKETAIGRAQYESKPQEQLVGYKLDKDGNLQRSPSGMSNAELNAGGWHAETFPDEQRKRLEVYPQFKGMYDHVKEEVLTNPVFKEPEKYKAWWDIAKTYFQQGLPIPFTSITAGGAAVGSEDRQRLSSALAVMGQMTELIANPSGKDNASIAALKNYITSPNAKPSGILSALDSVYETELAGIRGILGTTKGSVEPGRPSPTDIRRERESRTPGSSMEKRNVTEGESVEPLGQGSIRKKKGNALDIDKLEGVKGRLDRSKFKAVSP